MHSVLAKRSESETDNWGDEYRGLQARERKVHYKTAFFYTEVSWRSNCKVLSNYRWLSIVAKVIINLYEDRSIFWGHAAVVTWR